MLTPMLVQYLVGLCCLRRNPTAVDITLGDTVLDTAAGEERDVDVTVTLEEEPGVTRAFKAFEVRRATRRDDVRAIEQLCRKLLDMPSLTHRAIVSASGFTKPAQAKAAHHGIELFALKPWTHPLEQQFPGFGTTGLPDECLHFSRNLLVWIDYQLRLVAPDGPTTFNVEPQDQILTRSGEPHPTYATWAELENELLLRSTEILFPLEPAATVLRTFPTQRFDPNRPASVSPMWPHTHTLDVTRDNVYIRLSGAIVKLETVTINGYLQWKSTAETPQYHVMQRIPDGEVFAGAMVALGKREGEMFGFVVSPISPDAGVHIIRLEEKHKNVIRKLKLEVPPPQSGEP